ncbi:MAG: hypothetical protein HZA78_10665 [Candidatus Schekmanbacteria bacterium]|nr:hypothetical protein [Candidatus Schekmanbacteria bacterium]
MTNDEIKLELEQVRGDIKNLETVIRMSISEQKGLNQRHEENIGQIGSRIGRVENKLWWIQGLLGSTGLGMLVMILKLLAMTR